MTTTRAFIPVSLTGFLVVASCSLLEAPERGRERAAAALALRQSLRSFPGLGITLLPPALREVSADRAGDTQLASRNAELEGVMMTLFKDSGINVLIDSGVSGSATFDLKDVTPEAAFEALLKTYDLAYRWDGNFLRISRLASRSFDIDFPLPGLGVGGGGAGSGGAGSVGLASSAGAGGGGAGGILDRSSVWSRLEEDLRVLAKGDEGHRLIVNSTLGSVIVEGRPSTLERISDYVTTLRRRAMRQVSIEARILEVTLNDAFRTGVDFSLLPSFLRSSSGKRSGTLAGGAIVTSSNSAAVGALQIGLSNAGQFSLFIDALEQQGQVRVLSSPRISTLNNHTARIRIVQQVPVILRQIIDSQAGSRTEFSVRFEEAGVAVDVTPQISEDGMITCRISPKITEVSGFVETPDNLIREPILNTRGLDTTLQVRDGQPIVLGGLRGKRTSEELDKIPWLGDIPLLGVLFRKTSQTLEETELVIVMMPRILDSAWQREDVLRGVDRVERLRRPYKLTAIGRLREQADRWWQQMLGGRPRGGLLQSRRVVGRQRRASAEPGATITRQTLAKLSLRRGLALLERGEQAAGQRRIDESLALDPSMVHGWLISGVLAFRAHRFARAAQAFEECLRWAPGDADANNNLGLVHLRSGNPMAARSAFEKALAQHSVAETQNNLGIALMALGQLEAARAQFEKAIEARPELAEAQLNLGVCYDLAGAKTRAARAYEAYLVAGGDVNDARLVGLREHIQGARQVIAEAAAAALAAPAAAPPASK